MAITNSNIDLLTRYAPLLGYDTSKLTYQKTGDSRMAAGAGQSEQYLYGTPGFNYGLRSGAYGQQATDVTRVASSLVDQLKKYEASKLVKDSQGRLAYGTIGNLSAPVHESTVSLPGLTPSTYFDTGAKTTKNNSGFMVTKDYFGDLNKQFEQAHPGYMQVPLNNDGDPDAPRIWAFEDPNTIKYDPTYGYIMPKANYHPSSADAFERYGPYVPLLLFGAGALATAASGGAAAGAGTGATGTGAGAATGTGTGLSSAGTGTGLASSAGTFNGIGVGSGLGSGGLVGGTASTGVATGSGTFFGIGGAGSTGAALGTTAAGGIGVSTMGTGSGISTSGAAAQSLGIPAGGYPGAGITASGGLVEGGTLQGTYGTGSGALSGSNNFGLNSGAAALGNTSGTANTIGSGSGLTSQQLLDYAKTGQQVLGAVSGAGGLGGGGGTQGGQTGGGSTPVAPHQVNWTPWTSPVSALPQRQSGQQAQPQAAQQNPEFTPARSYDELLRQIAQYNQSVNGSLARGRSQMGL